MQHEIEVRAIPRVHRRTVEDGDGNIIAEIAVREGLSTEDLEAIIDTIDGLWIYVDDDDPDPGEEAPAEDDHPVADAVVRQLRDVA